MKNLTKWIKKQFTALSVALSNVEKNSLGQQYISIGTDTQKHQRHLQGTLADSLIRGEVTEEVANLRWRLFKILNASDKLIIKHISTNPDGDKSFSVEKATDKKQKSLLRKVKLDTHDNYPLELVINNKEITLSTLDVVGDDVLTPTGEIDNENYHSLIKTDKPIKIVRDLRPKFELEKFTKKLNIRSITDKQKLIEFYISKYPDKYDKKTNLLIAEIQRAMANPKTASILDIKAIGFTTYKSLGCKDFYQFQYKVNGFDKIIEFNGHYILKFKCEVIVDGEYLLEKYRVKKLDEKYNNKERKK